MTQRLAEAEGRNPQLALEELMDQLRESELERLRKEQLLLAAEDKAKKAEEMRIMERQGLIVGSQTLFDQAHALAELLRPTYDLLGKLVLEAPVLHADETRWPRLDKKANSNWTVWTRTTPEIAHYSILASKSRSAADTIFAGYRGIIVADGYQVYESLARDGPDLDLVNCWAHVRRKFADLRRTIPGNAPRSWH